MAAKVTVKPDGEKIRQLRSAAGLTGDAFAEASGVSLRTITNVESGKAVEIETIKRLAETLNVAVNELLIEPVVRRRARIIVTTTYEFEHFGEPEQAAFRDMLIRHAHPMGQITIAQVAQGSTIITIEMDEDDVPNLIAAFNEGKFDAGEVEAIAYPNTPKGGESLHPLVGTHTWLWRKKPTSKTRKKRTRKTDAD